MTTSFIYDNKFDETFAVKAVKTELLVFTSTESSLVSILKVYGLCKTIPSSVTINYFRLFYLRLFLFNCLSINTLSHPLS